VIWIEREIILQMRRENSKLSYFNNAKNFPRN